MAMSSMGRRRGCFRGTGILFTIAFFGKLWLVWLEGTESSVRNHTQLTLT